MKKTHRPYDPNQRFLLTPGLRNWLTEDHLVYFLTFLTDAVEYLDPLAFTSPHEVNLREYPAYHPQKMVKLPVRAHNIGIPSSRRIAQQFVENR